MATQGVRARRTNFVSAAAAWLRRRLGPAHAPPAPPVPQAVLLRLTVSSSAARPPPRRPRRSGRVQIPRTRLPQQPQEWWYFSGHLLGADPAGHLHCYGSST